MRIKLGVVALVLAFAASTTATPFDVRAFGATGDGRTLDSPAVNRAIAAAAHAGGGTVEFPAGNYLCGSLRLASHVTLHLNAGATITATADPAAYDAPEPNEWGDQHGYQDFGHSHFQNSLVWGVGLENVAITGFGRIDGSALARGENDEGGAPTAPVGNKAIALKSCRNVTLRDFTVLRGGWFAVLATGVDELTLDNLKIDTNRDGFDIDACQNVRITNCTVNSPNDDGICLKSSFALGTARPTKNVTIANCFVSGYDVGTLLDGTKQRRQPHLYKNSRGPHGRIKFGTESNGGFQNITIANCIFEYCRGLALETVDGALLEDVTVTNLTMRDIVNAPIFLRLGARLRGPEGTPVGALRRVKISHVIATTTVADAGILISGIPGHAIEDVSLSDILIQTPGGGTARDAERVVPEDEKEYPEPWRFGRLPSWGLYVRHAKNFLVEGVEFRAAGEERRPPVYLEDTDDFTFDRVKFPSASRAPAIRAKHVRDLNIHNSRGLPEGGYRAIEARDF